MVLARWVVAVLALVGAAVSPGWADAPRMTKEELKGLLGRPDVVVLDVRTGGDWTGSPEKIAGAVREEPGGEAAWAAKYGKDQTLVLYCA